MHHNPRMVNTMKKMISYAELGFLAMNVADGTDGESNRVERCQQNAYYAKSACGGLYIDSSNDGKKGGRSF